MTIDRRRHGGPGRRRHDHWPGTIDQAPAEDAETPGQRWPAVAGPLIPAAGAAAGAGNWQAALPLRQIGRGGELARSLPGAAHFTREIRVCCANRAWQVSSNDGRPHIRANKTHPHASSLVVSALAPDSLELKHVAIQGSGSQSEPLQAAANPELWFRFFPRTD